MVTASSAAAPRSRVRELIGDPFAIKTPRVYKVLVH
jgi:hypothetical protein